MPKIECTKFKYLGKGPLVGFADLYVPHFGLEIYGCAVFQSDGRKWLNFPSRESVDNEGKKKFFSHMRFRERKSMDNFSIQALAVVEPEIEKEKQIELKKAQVSPPEFIPSSAISDLDQFF
jgi:hypothetical protein